MVSSKRRAMAWLGAGLTAMALTAAGVATASADDGARRIEISDDCDPVTFNIAVGPGACRGNGETTFAAFIAELQRTRVAAEWNFDPSRATVKRGGMVSAVNEGGEVHTFTCVTQFGGGIVPPLNALSGNPVLAKLCSGEPFVGAPNRTFGATVVAPLGGQLNVNLADPSIQAVNGVYQFQCLIHPWMRTSLRIS